MSDSQPNRRPDPYERPSHKWSCGHSADGMPCRLGPDGRGRCRATFECTPALEHKPGETKGFYRCTRPPEFGGPCDQGPLPDGSCSRAISRCQPVRSWRSRRVVLTLATLMVTAAALLLGLREPFRYRMITPGPLSRAHSGTHFVDLLRQRFPHARLQPASAGGASDCSACHVAARSGPAQWMRTALQADPGPLEFRKLAASRVTELNRLDGACQVCHEDHLFHQPNVVADSSCASCHQEHRGAVRMAAVTSGRCVACHGDSSTMAAAAAKGRSLSPVLFRYGSALGRTRFDSPRPVDGYTKTIHSFSEDHPEFQHIREQRKDGDTLKFNHQRHLAADIRQADGTVLTCNSCHQIDAAGVYFVRMSFENQCQSCHGLQFYGLTVPHGSAVGVRAFLNSLSRQYQDYARRRPELVTARDRDGFVLKQLTFLRSKQVAGEDFESEIFLSGKDAAPAPKVGQLSDLGRPYVYGCAYCHEVKQTGEEVPRITPPVIPDRWLSHGSFNHLRHATVACTRCHSAAPQSRETADILLPSKSTCAECHSRQGGVSEECSTCHQYHHASSVLTRL